MLENLHSLPYQVTKARDLGKSEVINPRGSTGNPGLYCKSPASKWMAKICTKHILPFATRLNPGEWLHALWVVIKFGQKEKETKGSSFLHFPMAPRMWFLLPPLPRAEKPAAQSPVCEYPTFIHPSWIHQSSKLYHSLPSLRPAKTKVSENQLKLVLANRVNLLIHITWKDKVRFLASGATDRTNQETTCPPSCDLALISPYTLALLSSVSAAFSDSLSCSRIKKTWQCI